MLWVIAYLRSAVVFFQNFTCGINKDKRATSTALEPTRLVNCLTHFFLFSVSFGRWNLNTDDTSLSSYVFLLSMPSTVTGKWTWEQVWLRSSDSLHPGCWKKWKLSWIRIPIYKNQAEATSSWTWRGLQMKIHCSQQCRGEKMAVEFS